MLSVFHEISIKAVLSIKFKVSMPIQSQVIENFQSFYTTHGRYTDRCVYDNGPQKYVLISEKKSSHKP